METEKAVKPRNTMNADIINLFLHSAIRLFREMFELRITSCPAYVLENQLSHRWEISGILGITGDYSGIISFRLPSLLANKLLEKSEITITDENERRETVYSMVGELTNIISSNVSDQLVQGSISISPPAVIIGKNHRILWPKTTPVIAIPFSTQYGPFEVDVCMK
ncbi:chemotaxis protein CheX [Marispirochaeta aestuarii]|uniref:chemotaxis protein CheX n=1 Tax=Marispirochaeta aestuarii TaxID=1963862 RepID=UPI0029C79E3E|nr:chemotaxis protein CheX [Marispirochaeta aestuarii]